MQPTTAHPDLAFDPPRINPAAVDTAVQRCRLRWGVADDHWDGSPTHQAIFEAARDTYLHFAGEKDRWLGEPPENWRGPQRNGWRLQQGKADPSSERYWEQRWFWEVRRWCMLAGFRVAEDGEWRPGEEVPEGWSFEKADDVVESIVDDALELMVKATGRGMARGCSWGSRAKDEAEISRARHRFHRDEFSHPDKAPSMSVPMKMLWIAPKARESHGRPVHRTGSRRITGSGSTSSGEDDPEPPPPWRRLRRRSELHPARLKGSDSCLIVGAA